ncbi:uncharacterized protein LOC110459092 [Mizuhopecten yessoensis]|uniref:uncharacterized protein LOC110459092 n=1 Tax=Mizuhopecten yessoensis TaxID=6573 RepID=UPI000B45BA8D|nr:uncharacterized protein LOC110459092 [Mizuhopecten yessoensis]
MYLVTLIFLVTASSIVYAESANQTTHSATADFNTILLVVSDLTKRVERLTKYRVNDLNVIASLEAKIDLVEKTNHQILEENRTYRNRIKNLENLHQQHGQKVSTSVHHSKQIRGARRPRRQLFMNWINYENTMNENPNENNKTTDTIHKATDIRSIIEEQNNPRINQARSHTNKMENRKPQQGALRVGAPTDGSVAFYAYLSASINEPGDAYTIKFDHVITNNGNHYNPVTGAFTCPKDGVYVFNWSIGRNSIGFIHSELRKNGAAIGYSTSADDHYPTDSSQSSVLVLSQGDVVTAAVTGHSSSPKLWRYHTSFTGFLIH